MQQSSVPSAPSLAFSGIHAIHPEGTWGRDAEALVLLERETFSRLCGRVASFSK